jgi:methylenetetrahydrofolate dehydrogenase (NADP+)/methenyltetrahydrofolate cyclohydrolase
MHSINGRIIAQDIEEKLKRQINHGKPCLVTIGIGDDPSSKIYRDVKERACNRLGIKSIQIDLPLHVNEKIVIKKILDLNCDETVHGILIHHPLPTHLNHQKIIQAINPLKDVDGLHPLNLGNILLNNEYLTPCTPAAVIKILEYEKISLRGKDVSVINHSPIVGKPLAIMLLNRDATVTICHVHTKELKKHTRKADILITGTGVPGLITNEYIKNESIVIDIGISRRTDGKICGDVKYSSVLRKAKAVTPVPGGVGPVTVAQLMENCVKTYTRLKQ